MRIGVISDTHGMLRPSALRALAESDLIVHAGDVGDAAVLHALATIAPVVAVRGNCDTGILAASLAAVETVHAEGIRILVLHDLKDIQVSPAEEGVAVVITGHSHKPVIKRTETTLYLNPGSAGRRRFRLPVTVARLEVTDGRANAVIVSLEEDR